MVLRPVPASRWGDGGEVGDQPPASPACGPPPVMAPGPADIDRVAADQLCPVRGAGDRSVHLVAARGASNARSSGQTRPRPGPVPPRRGRESISWLTRSATGPAPTTNDPSTGQRGLPAACGLTARP